MRTLVAAEAFGFGPASKAKTVAAALRRTDAAADFAGRDTAHSFATRNADSFDDVYDLDDVALDDLLASTAYDCVVSVMALDPVVAATEAGVPAVLVDSLFWMWEWETPTATLDAFEARRASDGVAAACDPLSVHEGKLVAHALADRSFVQSFPNPARDDVPSGRLGDVTVVDPIVDVSYRRGAEPKHVVVSLCGQLSPEVPLSRAVRYAETTLDCVGDGLRALQRAGYEPVLAGNERVLDRVTTAFRTDSMSHARYLETLDAAAALLCPPSLTSLCEAATYGTPVFLLPEHHGGHPPNYERVRRAGPADSYPGVVFAEDYPALREVAQSAGVDDPPAAGDATIPEMYEVLAAVGARAPAAFPAIERLPRFADADYRSELADAQRAAVLGDAEPSVGGGRQVAEAVRSAYAAHAPEK
jgi:hypothetical protein